MGKAITVSGLKPGDVVNGHTVLSNRPLASSDGEVERHELELRSPDGSVRPTVLPRRHRVIRE